MAGRRTSLGTPDARIVGELAWHDRWGRVGSADLVSTGALAIGTALVLFLAPEPTRRWRGVNAFDERMRKAFLLSNVGAVDTARMVSDLSCFSMAAYPAIDALALVITRKVTGDAGLQMLLIDLHALALTGFLSLMSESFVGRERPSVRLREGYPDFDPNLVEARDNVSFFSGHTAISMASAGLICTHHSQLALYGTGPGGAIACGLAMATATTVGLLRIASDDHYTSDVLVGASVGLFSGLILPRLFYYGFGLSARRKRKKKEKVARLTLVPVAIEGGMMMSYAGAS